VTVSVTTEPYELHIDFQIASNNKKKNLRLLISQIKQEETKNI